jgi:hypothetical protein
VCQIKYRHGTMPSFEDMAVFQQSGRLSRQTCMVYGLKATRHWKVWTAPKKRERRRNWFDCKGGGGGLDSKERDCPPPPSNQAISDNPLKRKSAFAISVKLKFVVWFSESRRLMDRTSSYPEDPWFIFRPEYWLIEFLVVIFGHFADPSGRAV